MFMPAAVALQYAVDDEDRSLTSEALRLWRRRSETRGATNAQGPNLSEETRRQSTLLGQSGP